MSAQNWQVLVKVDRQRPGYVAIWNMVTDERVLIHTDGIPELLMDLARAMVEAQP